MFDQLLTTFLTLRRTAAPYLETGVPASPAAGPSSPTAPVPARAPPTAAPRPVPPAAGSAPARPLAGPLTYVRVVKDGRPIEVGSETVDLRTDDILSLPPESAKILVDGKVAEAIIARPLGPRV